MASTGTINVAVNVASSGHREGYEDGFHDAKNRQIPPRYTTAGNIGITDEYGNGYIEGYFAGKVEPFKEQVRAMLRG